MKCKGAAGPNNIPPSFLKSLGLLALQELLSIFNSSFSLAHCPLIWRVAIIIPLLKAGKSPCKVASFRPIRLTSCVVKLVERILADRLYYIAETKNLFSLFQAGFRKGRSCEDQITQTVQAKEDGFQQRPMQRFVLTPLDFSKAYDTVWKEKLLVHMLDTGIPSTFIHWIRSFFNDCRARVQLFTIFSDDPPTHERVALVYQHQKASRDSKQIKNREDDVLLARFTIYLSISIFNGSTQLKIQFA